MFVLSPVGPTFDLETKKSFFCRVSDYALSYWSLAYRTKTTFFRQAFQFNVGREILGAAKQAKISPKESFRAPSRHIWCTATRFSRVEKNFVDRKIISSTGSFLLAYSKWKAFFCSQQLEQERTFLPRALLTENQRCVILTGDHWKT